MNSDSTQLTQQLIIIGMNLSNMLLAKVCKYFRYEYPDRHQLTKALGSNCPQYLLIKFYWDRAFSLCIVSEKASILHGELSN